MGSQYAVDPMDFLFVFEHNLISGDEWWPMVETLPCGPKARRNKTCFEQMLDLFFLFFFRFWGW